MGFINQFIARGPLIVSILSIHNIFSDSYCACLTMSTPKILGLGMDIEGEWVPSAVVVSMLLLASVHLCLTKSDMHLGLAALRELSHKVPSQHELDRQERFEAELLKV